LRKTEDKVLSIAEAQEKLRYYCGYQERSRKQVVQKMKLLGLSEDWFEKLILNLEEDGYLDENRFKALYVRSKCNVKGWGPIKIEQHLRFELGHEANVSELLKEEDAIKAKKKLARDLEKKYNQLSQKKDSDIQGKLIRFCLSRGFSFDLAKELVNLLVRVAK